MEGGVTALAPASNYGHNKPEPEAEVDVLVLFVDYQVTEIGSVLGQSSCVTLGVSALRWRGTGLDSRPKPRQG